MPQKYLALKYKFIRLLEKQVEDVRRSYCDAVNKI